MNKKLENVLIVDGKANDIISFLEVHGGTNQYHKKSNNSKDGYFIDTFGCIIRTIHREFHETILTLEQAQELVNSKPELTFPRKMLVWSTQAAKPVEKTVICKFGESYVTLDNPIIDKNYTQISTCLIWAHAKELPTQQEINQEKIEQLQRDLVKLQEQEFTLEEQINQLKSQNCG